MSAPSPWFKFWPDSNASKAVGPYSPKGMAHLDRRAAGLIKDAQSVIQLLPAMHG